MAKTILMTQTEFGRKIGVSQQQISKYIQQGKIPTDCLQGKKIIVSKAKRALRNNLDPSKAIKAKIGPLPKVDFSFDPKLEHYFDDSWVDKFLEKAIVEGDELLKKMEKIDDKYFDI